MPGKQMKKLILLACVLLSGCGATSDVPTQLPGIVKSEYFADGYESSVVVMGAQLVHIVSRRPWVTVGVSSTTAYRGNEAFDVPAPGFEYISVLVHEEIVYVFGTINNRSVQMVSSADLVTWTTPVTVIEIKGSLVYNTSVTRDADGFVMAYETDFRVPFTINFARSYDLYSWFQVGAQLHPEIYAACPTVKFIDGYYYVFYLRRTNKPYKYYTWVERSADLVTWEPQTSLFSVLSPERGEGTNTSDIDLIEFNGVTHMVYLAGDQTSGVWAKKAEYQGTLASLVGVLFAD